MKKTIFIFLFSLLFPVIPLFARIRIPIPVPAGGAGIVVIIIIIIINIAIRVAGSGGKGSYVRVQKKLSTKLFNTGIFYCPNCKKQQEYSHYKLYYDINKFWSEYIECNVCKQTYKRGVLQYEENMEKKKKEVLSVFQETVRNIMIKIMLADNVIDTTEKEKIREIYKNLTKNEYAMDALNQDIERVKKEGRMIGEYVRQANTLLNTEGKKMLLSAAVYISAADRIIKRSEKKLLKSLARQLGLSSQEIDKIINSIRQNLSLEEEVDDSENNEDTPSEWICTWCGKTNEPTTEFCSRCNEPNRLSRLHK